jgi:hypothetical protein
MGNKSSRIKKTFSQLICSIEVSINKIKLTAHQTINFDFYENFVIKLENQELKSGNIKMLKNKCNMCDNFKIKIYDKNKNFSNEITIVVGKIIIVTHPCSIFYNMLELITPIEEFKNNVNIYYGIGRSNQYKTICIR